ncbi:MAG: AraC family transcriptional regulator [Lachnospiraceae bacterium]|nr:AraC family transcriptional regulator [Lachnospiraceae bacterium]
MNQDETQFKEYDVAYETYDEGGEVKDDLNYPVHVYFIELSKQYMKNVQWNWHTELEVVIVNHGDIIFKTHEAQVTLSAGMGIVINSNTMHTIEPSGEDSNCSMYSATFHPTFLFGYGHSLLYEKYLTPVVSSPKFQYLVLSEDTPEESKMLDCINNVIAANLIKNYGYELTTKSLLCNFWLILSQKVAPAESVKASKPIASNDEIRTKEMILYIEEHYADKVTLEDLADTVHISKSECCRCFKRALNLTPIEYLMKYRIYMAATLIQKKDKKASSFSELAFNVGFNNASYFNKVFRQYLGYTPSEYRRKVNSDPNFDLFTTISI